MPLHALAVEENDGRPRCVGELFRPVKKDELREVRSYREEHEHELGLG